MTSHNLHESLSLFLWIFKFFMWIFLQFNQWKRLFFIPSGRGKKHTFKLFENTLILCFQASGSGAVPELLYLSIFTWNGSQALTCGSEPEVWLTFFFPPHCYLLKIGQLPLMAFQLAVVREYLALLHKSSSLSKLVDLVNDYWYKLE